MSMLPLLIVALLVWAGVFVFLWVVDRRVAALEARANRMAQNVGAVAPEENR